MAFMESFALEIVTPEGRLATEEVELVEFPGSAGEMGIYAGHTPLLVALGVGEMRVHRRGEVEHYAVAEGYVQIRPDFVRVAATFASTGEEEAHIEKACQRAKNALETAARESPAVIKGELESIKNQLVRIAEHRLHHRVGRGK